MSARTRLLFSEAWSSITANISTTFAATMTVLIGMFLLGLFIALGTWVLSWSDHVKKELQVKVYFTSVATPQQEAFVGQQLRKDHQRVKLVTFVSKAAAEKHMRKLYPTLYATAVPGNPLPDAWVVTPVKASDTPDPRREDQARALPRRRVAAGAGGAVGRADREAHPHDRGDHLDQLPRRRRAPRHGVDAPDREHDPALDLREAA